MATLADVARAAGVSLATASRAINGSSRRTVNPEMRERVLAVARELNYVPHAAAQTMARGRTATIGLVVPDISDTYFNAVAAGVSDAATENGLIVMLSTTGGDAETRLRVINEMISQRVRGVVLVGGLSDRAEVQAPLRQALAAVRDGGGGVAVVGQDVLEVPSVGVDEQAAVADLGRELLGLGYRRFGLLAGPAHHLTGINRGGELGRFLQANGGQVVASVHSPLTREGGRQAMAEVLDSGADPEVVCCVTDVMAIGALAECRARGVAVPGDLALAGFDDIAMLADIVPGITTVAFPQEEAGRRALELALSGVAGAPRVTVDHRIVLRESTPARA